MTCSMNKRLEKTVLRDIEKSIMEGLIEANVNYGEVGSKTAISIGERLENRMNRKTSLDYEIRIEDCGYNYLLTVTMSIKKDPTHRRFYVTSRFLKNTLDNSVTPPHPEYAPYVWATPRKQTRPLIVNITTI